MGSPVLLTTANSRLATNKVINVPYLDISDDLVTSRVLLFSLWDELLYHNIYRGLKNVMMNTSAFDLPCVIERQIGFVALSAARGLMRRAAENACAVPTC